MSGLESFADLQNLATTITESAWLWIGNFLVLIILMVVLLIFATRGGRSSLVSLILGLYAGYAVYLVFPYTNFIISAGHTTILKACISIALFLTCAVIPFLIIRRLTGGGFGSLSFLQNLLLSLLAATFFIALGYHVFDISNIYTFSEPLNQLFEPKGYFFYWFIAPLIGLFLFAR